MVLLAGFGVVPSPAAACFGDDCDQNDTITVSGGTRPRVEVTSSGRRSSLGPGVPAWVATCTHDLLRGSEVFDWLVPRSVLLTGGDMAPGFDPSAAWVMVRCPGHPNAVLAGDVYALYEPGDPPRRVVDLVIARAYGETALPSLVLASSPAGSVDRPLLARMETWLWAQGWGSASASASLPGVAATVTASPDTTAVWTLSGQGSGSRTLEVSCDGPGAPYGSEWDSDVPAPCSVTPDRVGGGGSGRPAVLSLRVRWVYAVACVPVPCSMALPDTVTESERPVTVIEVRGLLIDSNP